MVKTPFHSFSLESSLIHSVDNFMGNFLAANVWVFFLVVIAWKSIKALHVNCETDGQLIILILYIPGEQYRIARDVKANRGREE